MAPKDKPQDGSQEIPEDDPFRPDCVENPQIPSCEDGTNPDIEAAQADSFMIDPSFEKMMIESAFRDPEREQSGTPIKGERLYIHVNGVYNILSDIKSPAEEMHMINYLRMRRLCETIDPTTGRVSEFTEIEGMVLNNIFSELFKYDYGWMKRQEEKYHRLMDPLYTKNDTVVQHMYRQFLAFLHDLDRKSKLLMVATIGSKKILEVADSLPEDEREKIIKRIEKAGKEKKLGKSHWSLVDHILPSYYIIHRPQFADVMGLMKKNGFENIELRTLSRERGYDSTDIDMYHKNVLHYAFKDKDFDELERAWYLTWLWNRCGVGKNDWKGFMQRMKDERKKEDEVIYRTLNGEYDMGISMSLREAGRLVEVASRVEKLDRILKPFKDEELGGEEVAMTLYALENLIGIRGYKTIKFALKDYKIKDSSILDNMLHDSKIVGDVSAEDPDKCSTDMDSANLLS